MGTPECLNLPERFGSRYRVTYEESYRAEYGDRARTEDPWLMIIACRYGHLYPHGGTTLAARVDGHPNVANRLRRMRCCWVHQDGDFGELTVLFDVADFAQIAELMHPLRRRQVSEAERERLRQIGFKKGQQRHVEVQFSGQECVSEHQRDFEPVQRETALFNA